MKNLSNINNAEREIKNIQENYDVDYWQKKYGVSAEELKATNNVGIAAKIIEANSKKQQFEAVA
jgi:hypothetical protein